MADRPIRNGLLSLEAGSAQPPAEGKFAEAKAQALAAAMNQNSVKMERRYRRVEAWALRQRKEALAAAVASLFLERSTLRAISRIRGQMTQDADRAVTSAFAAVERMRLIKESAMSVARDLAREALMASEGRKEQARQAANAKHDKPGGAREKAEAIRALWATGKFSSRDRCAEEECAAAGMSFAAARRALRNTPEPGP
jgi:hypothetical protein